MTRIDFRRHRLVVVAAGCGVVTAFALLVSLRIEWVGPAGGGRPVEDEPEPASAEEPSSESETRLRSAREVAGQLAVPSAGGFSFVDASFGYPIFAVTVVLRDGTAVLPSADGVVRLRGPEVDLEGSLARALGYQDRSLPERAGRERTGGEPTSSLGASRMTDVVTLQPSRVATALVRWSDGKPAGNVLVAWTALEQGRGVRNVADRLSSRGAPRGTRLEARADAAGTASVRAACSVEVKAWLPDSPLTASAVVEPGQTIELVLPECGFELWFRDSVTGAPITDLPIETWRPASSVSCSAQAVSDEDGLVLVPKSPGPLLARIDGPARQGRLFEVSSPGARAESHGGEWKNVVRVLDPDCGTRIPVDVVACARPLTILNDVTGQEVEGIAFVDWVTTDPVVFADGTTVSPRSWRTARRMAGSGQELQVVDGSLHLPCHSVSNLRELQESPGTFVISIAGYRPLYLPSQSVVDIASGNRREWILYAAPSQRVELVAMMADGEPYLEQLTARSLEHNALLYAGTSAAHDGLRRFDGYGDEIEIDVRGEKFRRTPPSDGALELSLPFESASIVVTDVPVTAVALSLIAGSEVGPDAVYYAPRRWNEETLVFSGLPPGGYVLGPAQWVPIVLSQLGLSAGSARRSLATAVGAGETQRIAWLSAWSGSVDIDGFVKVEGSAGSEPFLIPAYAPFEIGTPPRLVLGRGQPRVPLSVDGHYRIDAGAPVPQLLVVCRVDDSLWGDNMAFHVVEVIAPGESVEIPTRTLALRWEGEPRDEPVAVRYTIPTSRLRHPIETFHQRSTTRWLTERELVLRGVPLHVDRLEIEDRVLELSDHAGVAPAEIVVRVKDLPFR